MARFKISDTRIWITLGASLLALPAVAQETLSVFDENGYLDSADPDMVIGIRLGAQRESAYFGSSDLENGPGGSVRFDYVRFPNGFEYGSGQTVGYRTGWGLRGSARFIGERNSADYPELAGLSDVDWTQEFGFGVGYEEKHFRGFADVRYGFFGHQSFVGEAGFDVIATPAEGWTLTLGPRLLIGSDKYTQTYFGVTADEPAASQYSEYDPNGGLVSAGVVLGARYDFNERWGIEAVAGYSRFVGDAGNSPIVLGGSDESLKIEVGITRRISVDF
ncbi:MULTISPECIES: MipA/OmpV family protein [Falsihalocynthiibacter]|uniref:MipA/OmpV family protein n=1 Tax=Falsihalocynthiibacter TaxID=2854182 RepID=UPI003001F98A